MVGFLLCIFALTELCSTWANLTLREWLTSMDLTIVNIVYNSNAEGLTSCHILVADLSGRVLLVIDVACTCPSMHFHQSNRYCTDQLDSHSGTDFNHILTRIWFDTHTEHGYPMFMLWKQKWLTRTKWRMWTKQDCEQIVSIEDKMYSHHICPTASASETG